jgi:hypothetical protein
MAVDGKYGRVTFERTPHTPIPDDEPVFILRAQDELAPDAIIEYAESCREAGSPQEHLSAIYEAHRKFLDWQQTHDTKIPD